MNVKTLVGMTHYAFLTIIVLGLSGCVAPITITSTPTAADVTTASGGVFGTTPVQVLPGSYQIKKVGYVPKGVVVNGMTVSPVNVELEREILRVTLTSRPPIADVHDALGNMIGQTPLSVAVTNATQSYDIRKFGYESKNITLTQESPAVLDVDLGGPIAGMTLMEIVVGDKGLEVKSSMVFSEKDVIERSPNVRAVKRLTDFSPTRWVGGFCVFPGGKKLLMEILDKELMQPGSTDTSASLLSNLWAMDVDAAGGLQRWTEGKYLDETPCFSDDGNFVYFSSSRAGKNAIFRMSVTNLKGLGMVTPGSTADSFPQVAPDGSTLIWTAAMGGSDIPQLWSMPLKQGLPAGLPMQIREGREPRWSPKGDLVLYSAVDRNIGKTKIWTMAPDGSQPTQLTTGSTCNDVNPFWFPDGSKVIFASDRGVAGGRQNFDIWVMDTDGSHPKQLTTNGSRDDHPVVSMDGKTVYFRSNRGLKWDVWVMEIAEETPSVPKAK